MRIAFFPLVFLFFILNKNLLVQNNPILAKYVWTLDGMNGRERNSSDSPELLMKKQDKAEKGNKLKYIWKHNDGKTRRNNGEESKDVSETPMNEREIIFESVFNKVFPQAQNHSVVQALNHNLEE